MKKIDAFIGLFGLFVGGLLTAYAYYSNSHSGAPRISETIYLIFFPPSIGLMVTENASVLGQVVIVSILVGLNAVLYGCISIVVRTIFGKAAKSG